MEVEEKEGIPPVIVAAARQHPVEVVEVVEPQIQIILHLEQVILRLNQLNPQLPASQ